VTGADGEPVAGMEYGAAANVWRMNVGWARRAESTHLGFALDTQNGYWAANDQATVPDQGDVAAEGKPTQRVIPFVQDTRNALTLEPTVMLSLEAMASLQAALKRAVQAVFQLEDSELAAEPLPDGNLRRRLLLFESAEGGAGVLRRLLDDPDALARVAREALVACHFDPDTGEDVHHAAGATETCEAACYDCLLSYGNQREHGLLDRHLIRDVLQALARSTVTAGGGGRTFSEHAQLLMDSADSELERRFVRLLVDQQRALPSHAQKLVAGARARPDFLYVDDGLAVFIDGPHHDEARAAQRDEEAVARLKDAGWDVVRLHHGEDWPTRLDELPSVFGTGVPA
jgi:very-short-patch-repair endonuclease